MAPHTQWFAERSTGDARDHRSPSFGGPDRQLIGNVIERQLEAADDWPVGAAMSFILMCVTFAVLTLRAWFSGRDL